MGICPEMNSKFPVLITGTYDPAGVGGFGSAIPNSSSLSSIKIFLPIFD
jgi:hypothetical protein